VLASITKKGEIEREMVSNISYNWFWCLTTITKPYGLTSLPSWSFLRCIKFTYTYKENDPWGNSKSMEQNRFAPAYGAPDCPVCCPVPRLARPANWPLSGKLSAPRLKIIGLSGEPTSNGRLHQWSTTITVCSVRRSEIVCDVRCHRTVQCTTMTCEFNGRLLQTPTVGWRGTHRIVNSAMSSAHRTVRCARRQRSQPTTRIVVGAINTPIHHHSRNPSFPLSTFNTRAKNTLQKHIQSLQSSPSAIINSSDQKCLVTWERVILCFNYCSCCLVAFFFSF
jgi:hypothetical protein